MTELDFDELDKAVNSLMSNVDTSKRTEGLDDPQEKVVSIAPSTPVASVPGQDAASDNAVTVTQGTSSPAVSSAPPAPSSPAAPLAIKRRGQFMDVMHPSSDMKSTPAPSVPTGREGVSIKPTNENIVPEQPVTVKPEDKQLDTIAFDMESTANGGQPAAEAQTPPAAPAKSEWPDPIEVAAKTEPATPVVVTEQPKVDLPKPPADSDLEDSLQQALEEPTDKPSGEGQLVSPFLPDTKVEKRPLGQPTMLPEHAGPDKPADLPAEPVKTEVSEPEKSEQPEAPKTDESSGAGEQKENSEDQKPGEESTEVDAQVAPKIELPDELKSDVVALEASSTSTGTAGSANGPVVMPQPFKPVEQAAPVPDQPVAAKPADHGHELAGGSIPQQYTEQPSTGDQSSTPIYDTDTYHKALDKPPKKKSFVKIVIWFLVLLIVGALAGAAYFYFQTTR